VVLAVFVALVVLGTLIFPPHIRVGAYIAYVVAMIVLLTAVCWLKGEPPRWRWGGD
jgi:hypothetical protein